MKSPQIINANVPEPCVVCGEHDNTLSPMLLPWRTSEGWWCCNACSERLLATRMYPTMNARQIIPTGALPEWFRSIGTFNVSRSSGALTKMAIVDFKCSFSQNKDNGPTTDGRVRLSDGKVYIDMCDETKTYFKQVTIDNLYQNNPKIALYGIVELEFPPYVSRETQAEWRAAMLAAATAAELDDAIPGELISSQEKETFPQVKEDLEVKKATADDTATTIAVTEAPVDDTAIAIADELKDLTLLKETTHEVEATEAPIDDDTTNTIAVTEETALAITATQISAPGKPDSATTHITVAPTPKFSFW